MADVAQNTYQGWLYAENAVIGAMLIDEQAAPATLGAVSIADIRVPHNREI